MFVNVSDLNGLALDYWVARSLHDFVREIYFTDSGETVAVRGNDRGRPWDGRFTPSTSWEAAAAVLEGRRLYPRRADLQAVIAVDDAARTAGLTDGVKRQALRRGAAHRADPTRCPRDDVETALAAASRVASSQPLSDDELATLGCALTDAEVRDILYALAVGENAGEVESLWALLARTLPEPWRVEALVLLAFSAYARGDGPLAGVSLEAALRCSPDHRMAGMLDIALQTGLRPDDIRELAHPGYRLAKRFGVRIPPRRPFGRRAC